MNQEIDTFPQSGEMINGMMNESQTGGEKAAPREKKTLLLDEEDCSVLVPQLEDKQVAELEAWMRPRSQDDLDETWASAPPSDGDAVVVEEEERKWSWELFRSEAGFLACGQQLRDVCAADDAVVKRAGLTHEQIATALEKIDDNPHVRTVPNQCWACDGFQACPFQCVDGLQNYDQYDLFRGDDHRVYEEALDAKVAEVTPKSKKQSERRLLTVSRLGIHLIRRHHFYQGPGLEYRIDPEAVIEMLHVAPFSNSNTETETSENKQ